MRLIYRNGDEVFYMWKEIEEKNLIIGVTNLKQLWRGVMTENDILREFKSANPLIQAKPDWIVNCVHTCLDPSGYSFTLKIIDNQLFLDVSQSSDIKLKMHFGLELQDNEEFYKNVTNPFVAIINQLLDQRTKLTDLIKSKDEELKEYKLEGANISRKNVETEAMDETDFVGESTTDFLNKSRQLKKYAEVSLTPDLTSIFTKIPRYTEEGQRPTVDHSNTNDSRDNKSSMNEPTLPKKLELKRPIGNQTIIQVPRVKHRKKNFNL